MIDDDEGTRKMILFPVWNSNMSISGGKSINYMHKYLKYKQKYLNKK